MPPSLSAIVSPLYRLSAEIEAAAAPTGLVLFVELRFVFAVQNLVVVSLKIFRLRGRR